MSARWRAQRRSAYAFERTMTERPTDVVVVDQIGSEVWAINNGEQFQVPGSDNPGDEWAPYEANYDPDVTYVVDAVTGGEIDSSYSPEFPGQREDFHAEWEDAQEYSPSQYPDHTRSYDRIDWEVGGQFGLVNNFPYSMGVVSSDLVENFELTGEQVVLRRETEARMAQGPVGTADANAMLALAYVQTVNQYYPNEFSQADLVVSV